MFSVSVILVDLDLSNDLTVLVLLVLGVSTVLLGAFVFLYFVDCVNFLFI